jgi:hypothetical protein
LLVLEGERLAQQELIFRAVQADSFGPARERCLGVGDPADIGVERYPEAIWGFSR